jgi:site-specific DNA-methyltransferase (adenine-specific)
MQPDFSLDGVRAFNCDCMEFMKDIPDNFYELAIVDPPYGIGINKGGHTLAGNGNFKGGNFKVPARKYSGGEWDNFSPDKEYFVELIRISKNQIIWGANHFISKMPFDSSGWIVWDKDNGGSYQADCELAYTSFNKAVRKFRFRWWGLLQENMVEKEKRIHPTQKPVEIYKMVLRKYAKKGDKIFDSHGGSMSIAIACLEMGYSLDICELDNEYFEAAKKRVFNSSPVFNFMKGDK